MVSTPFKPGRPMSIRQDVGTISLRQNLHGVGAVFGLAHHVKFFAAAQDGLDAIAHDLVIIHEQDVKWHSTGARRQTGYEARILFPFRAEFLIVNATASGSIVVHQQPVPATRRWDRHPRSPLSLTSRTNSPRDFFTGRRSASIRGRAHDVIEGAFGDFVECVACAEGTCVAGSKSGAACRGNSYGFPGQAVQARTAIRRDRDGGVQFVADVA